MKNKKRQVTKEQQQLKRIKLGEEYKEYKGTQTATDPRVPAKAV